MITQIELDCVFSTLEKLKTYSRGQNCLGGSIPIWDSDDEEVLSYVRDAVGTNSGGDNPDPPPPPERPTVDSIPEGALGPPTECPKCAQWKNVGKRFCPAHWVNIVKKEGDRLSKMVKGSPKELRDYIHELETRCQ